MEIANETPFPVALLPSLIRPKEPTATLIVKGSFSLRPGAPAMPLSKPLPFQGDVPRDEEEPADLRYEADLAPWKLRTDLLLVGTCHAPGGKPTVACRATFAVGSWSKGLAVIGDRVWKKGLLGSSMSEPIPFTRLPLDWPHAYGGPKFEANPAGKGHAGDVLPNIEPLERRISSPGDQPEPSGFGPISRLWPQRTKKVGSYRGKWLKERWPGVPDDFDWTYYNAAPVDQQLEQFLRGDEDLALGNLRPDEPDFRAKLPGLRIRCFITEKLKDSRRFLEVPMKIDTLFVDADQAQLVLLWRGIVPVASEELDQIEHAGVVSEPLKDPPLPAANYERFWAAPPSPEAPEEPEAPPGPERPIPGEEEIKKATEEAAQVRARALEEWKKALAPHQIDVDSLVLNPAGGGIKELRDAMIASKELWSQAKIPLPPGLDAEIAALAPGGALFEALKAAEALGKRLPKPAWTAERVKAQAQSGGLAQQDLTGADLRGASLAGLDLREIVLHKANLARADLSGADLSGATITEADLTEANLAGCNLSKADLTRAKLGGANLRGATLDEAELREAILARAILADVQASTTVLAGADLSEADLSGARLYDADLGGANLSRAKLSKANLTRSSLTGARGEAADFSEADLTALQAAGAQLPKGVFQKTVGEQCVFQKAILDGADFSSAKLLRASFSQASLKKALFPTADLKYSSFQKAILEQAQFLRSNLFQGSFEKADLTGADLSGANLYGSELLGAVLERVTLTGANVKMTKLA